MNKIAAALLFLLPLSLFAQKSALYLAIDEQNVAKVKKEIINVKNIEERGQAGHTLLMTAARRDNLEIVILLVKKGADVNAQSKRGSNVVHAASMSKNPEILKYIISKGANANINSKGVCSPFDAALRYNSLENARTLLKHGSKSVINKKCRGYTPLMVGVSSEEITKFLLKNGADKNIKTRSGKTALDLAKEQKVPSSIIKLLSSSKKKQTKSIDPLVSLSKKDKGLMWERKTLANKYDKFTEQDAKDYCKKLNWAGESDWRVPTLKEYKTILLDKPITDFYISGVGSYYINPKKFPNLVPLVFWAKEKNKMLYLNVSIKRSGNVCSKCTKNMIRCVSEK